MSEVESISLAKNQIKAPSNERCLLHTIAKRVRELVRTKRSAAANGIVAGSRERSERLAKDGSSGLASPHALPRGYAEAESGANSHVLD